MKLKVLTENLRVGMFVYELDRPWLDTPFLFQGFLIEERQQIDDLCLYCRFVYVDEAVSSIPVNVSVHNASIAPQISYTRVAGSAVTASDLAIFDHHKQHGNAASQASFTGRWLAGLREQYPIQTLIEDELPVAKKIFQSAGEAAYAIFKNASASGVLDGDKLREAVADITESVTRNPDALLLLSYLKRKSTYSYDHAISVSIHLLAFGRHIGLSKDQLHVLGAAGLLLDVGMVRLPESILDKKGQLTPAEYDTMKSHVQFGVDIIGGSPDFSSQIADILSQHHERENGSGYPRGLKESDITPFGKMAAIVDCFVALISERPYADSIAPMGALKMLYNWRTDFYQADMVEQFIQCLGPYPVGSFIELNTGEVAVVLAHNRVRRLRPKIMVVLDTAKKAYGAPVMLDLISNPLAPNNQPYEIKSSVPDGVYEIDLQEFYL